MDWNLKAASWDLMELEEAGLPNIETVDTINDGSSRFGVGSVNRSKEGEFCVDLKLGQVGNSGGGVSKTASSPSPSGSSKRARAVNNTTQTVSCLVDGCNSDLSNCRDYHRRHKVCELHSKTPVVTIAGHEQRFCQQCSRFHSLEEFDEGKRSCRKRLDGHNRRRRKPQAVGLTRSANFLSNYQGSQVLPLSMSSSSSSHVYPSSGVGVGVGVGWDARFQQVQKQELYVGSSSSSGTSSLMVNNGNKQEMAPFLVTNLQNPCVGCVWESSSTGMMRTTTTTREESPPRALSLLSSPVVETHSSSTPLSLMHPLGLNLHHHSFHTSLSSIYDIDSHASQGNQPPPSLPFHWE